MKKIFLFLTVISSIVFADNIDNTVTKGEMRYINVTNQLRSPAALQARDKIDYTKKRYDFAKNELDNNPDDLELKQAATLAEQNYRIAQDNYSTIISNSTPIIKQMRMSGKDWHEIADELNVDENDLKYNPVYKDEDSKVLGR